MVPPQVAQSNAMSLRPSPPRFIRGAAAARGLRGECSDRRDGALSRRRCDALLGDAQRPTSRSRSSASCHLVPHSLTATQCLANSHQREPARHVEPRGQPPGLAALSVPLFPTGRHGGRSSTVTPSETRRRAHDAQRPRDDDRQDRQSAPGQPLRAVPQALTRAPARARRVADVTPRGKLQDAGMVAAATCRRRPRDPPSATHA